MTAPPECPECHARMRLRQSKHGPFWSCGRYPFCTGTHGAHPDGRPLGTPAPSSTKQARVLAHKYFDQLWQGKEPKGLHRSAAYAWLAAALGLAPADTHIGQFDKRTCERVAVLAVDFLILHPEGITPHVRNT